jgi:Rieske Fe-S protein
MNPLWDRVRACFRRPLVPRGAVAREDKIPVGGFKLFAHPSTGDPCILVRTAPDAFVAYSRTCTHRACAVRYSRENQRLECPCHRGAFDVATGAVTGGPPPLPLPRIVLERRGGWLFAARVGDGPGAVS